jgi:hypothetical protein
MEISTGQSQKQTKNDLIQQINSIQDKNSKEYRDKIRELETALGIKEVNVFGTANRKIFEENLDNMSSSEIQNLASKLKIDPSGSKPMIKKRLMQQFDTQNVQSRGYFVPQQQNKALFSDEQKEKLNKILNG